MKYIFITLVVLSISISMSSCKQRNQVGASLIGNPTFFRQTELLYAQNFEIMENGIHIKMPWKGAPHGLFYTNNPIYESDSSRQLPFSLDRLVCLSTTHVSMLTALGQEDRIVGASNLNFIESPKVRKLIEAKKIQEINNNGKLDIEKIISLKPDMVIAYAINAEDCEPLDRLGIPVLYVSEFLETDPLGRAEWIKMFGALLGKQEQANRFFSNTAGQYEAIKKFRWEDGWPKILVGSPFQGKWYLPGAQSFLAQLIRDAGGDYKWMEQGGTASVILSLEEILQQTSDADVWIDVGTVPDLITLASNDERIKNIKAYRLGNVYNYSKRRSAGGGYAIFEEGVTEPHKILQDLIKAFHPEDVPDQEFSYYEKLSNKSNNF